MLKVNDYVLIYKNISDVLFSEVGSYNDLLERKKEIDNMSMFTAYIVQVIELPNKPIKGI